MGIGTLRWFAPAGIVWVAATAGAGSAPAAEPAASREDLLRVLAAAPWPLEMLAYCYREVARDPTVQEAGRQWNERNGGLLANIEARAAEAGIPADVRRLADEASLAAIAATVGRQYDKPAYCLTIAQIVESGAYDIDQRADLRDALKRIFGKD